MSLFHPRIVSGVAAHGPLQDDDDELDDICPVCESECTCPKKPPAPSTVLTRTASSTYSSALSSNHTNSAGKRPLKIKLTLPPNLKPRKPPATHATSNAGAHLGSAAQDAGPSSAKTAGPSAGGPAPKRRGRPPKALTPKVNTKKRAAADDMEYKARGTTGTSATARKVYQPPKPAPTLAANTPSTADLSDSTLSDFPTFVPAASESTHSSSSESSDSSIDSDDESDDDDHFVVRNDDGRHSTKLLPSHVGHRSSRRDRTSSNKWEIRPRKKSVGVEEEEEEATDDSGESSDESSEDGDDEDNAEEDMEADVEGGGLLIDAHADMKDEEEEMHSRIGVSFPGTGWSEDEDESFDADLFFANLDSDSGASSPEMQYTSLPVFASGEEVDLIGAFSADEEDALLLMDIDSSIQLRRGRGEFEIGVDLDSLAFGWDGQLLFSNANGGGQDGLGLSFSFGSPDEDEEMASVSGSDETAEWEGSGTVILQESDGNTTEDELVDSDGLPNPRAMMLFKWPTTISAINPLSTLSPSSFSDPPPPVNASPSTRIALATISAHRRSPPPTPSPADILAGRVSMEDLEDIEMEKLDQRKSASRRRRDGGGMPIMGEFVVERVHASRKTAVVGPGAEAPSFYPRTVRVPKLEPVEGEPFPVEDPTMSIMRPQLTNESSEDIQELSQQSYVSDISSTEAIDLDDVLDSSFLDTAPSTQECGTDVPDQSQFSPIKPGASPHLHNLSRWDRVPMATFRRTRESATASGVDGAASDSGLGALQYHRGIGTMMGGMSLFTPPRPLGLDKMSRASARKKKGRHSHGSSPTLLPTRDGGVLGSPFAPAAGSSQNGYTNKSKKELKKEKAMMKRKMVAKTSQYRSQHQPHRAHHHHPNFKSRATNAVQRTNFASGASSSIPNLTI